MRCTVNESPVHAKKPLFIILLRQLTCGQRVRCRSSFRGPTCAAVPAGCCTFEARPKLVPVTPEGLSKTETSFESHPANCPCPRSELWGQHPLCAGPRSTTNDSPNGQLPRGSEQNGRRSITTSGNTIHVKLSCVLGTAAGQIVFILYRGGGSKVSPGDGDTVAMQLQPRMDRWTDTKWTSQAHPETPFTTVAAY